jgi:hypothetical protein
MVTFDQLGTFNRLHLAKLVFGADVIERSITQTATTLDAWGYRVPVVAKHRLRGVLSFGAHREAPARNVATMQMASIPLVSVKG